MKYIAKSLTENVNVTQGGLRREFARVVMSIALLVILTYALMGLLVDVAFSYVPISLDSAIGERVLVDLGEKHRIRNHDDRVRQAFTKAVAAAHEASGKATIGVSDSMEINAVALPGCRILVFQGLLEKLRTENELVFVIGHELGHCKNRDGMRAFGRMLVLAIGMLTLTQDDSIASDLLASSFELRHLSSSRARENAADLYGLEVLHRVYGSVGGYSKLMDVLENEDRGHEGWSLMRTHPTTQLRKEALRLEAERRGW